MPTIIQGDLNVATIHELSMQQYPGFFDALNTYRSNIIYTLYNTGYFPINEKLVNEDITTHTHDSLYLYLADKTGNINLGAVLDLGCGRGRGVDTIRRYYHTDIVFGADKDAIAVQLGKEDYPSVNFHEADAYDLPYNDNVFDTVFNINSSSFYGEDRTPFLQEVNRVLKSGGNFLFADAFKTHEEAASIKAVFEQFFDVVEVEDVSENAKQANAFNAGTIIDSGNDYLISINEHLKIVYDYNILVFYTFICKSKK